VLAEIISNFYADSPTFFGLTGLNLFIHLVKSGK